ncbi:sushi domain-containing protein 3 isoform X1 [Girardinichthys multiradiatus]|uniref:sushi domain-containing protein 3 isoform X1 n=1 Tax=Girardinichthys multiradiatus TaxID=208333 RepID=UPI001FAC98F8|nr:sushi domain-containing protein 3 isoform X1 [Girardinichthys multiradiatus]XP_047245881.1 sushi domain-containing protein 3 isoform X1 [Girardinichthys multiradiatus]XP_047245882.1 sushi domain-containing protein 3 isoform X1 [Girardinichthys multiradiatus]XP_047245883.1 sushi domain-containing protein 3 isoform X1 [Girardinichthys multiradiatus]XP_047245884.1 sushi domain-containing protein 3 isoform X1 [Girardinichthys multiradiatus]XP_047245886.1 sushi domain-containing protein 3 isofor
MSLRDRSRSESAGSHLWMLLLPLLCTLLLAQGSTLSPEDSLSTAATMLPDDWTNTTAPLQPDLQTVYQTPTEEPAEATTEDQTEALTEMQTQVFTNNYTGLSCVPVMPPRRGSFYVESGTGMSIGSVLAFWCREGYQLVGSDTISCHVRRGKPQWSNYLPVCEAIPRPEDRGLRVAVLASVVSGIVIFAMSLSFLVCCLQERSNRDRAKKEGRSRRREKRSGRRSECWLETEEGEWEAFPPPKIFHLSQRMNPRLAPDSPLYLTGGLSGYENRGYQRSQESLLKTSLPGLYRSEAQLYPHVVLQRVPTPTAPSAPSAPSAPLYLHLPPSSSAGSSPAHTTTQSQPRILAQYPTPTYPPNPNTAVPAYPHPTPAPIYPNPNPPPQRPWQ